MTPFTTLDLQKAVLAIGFVFYGSQCILLPARIAEFNRYGLPRMRVPIGLLELAGGVGVMVGFKFPLIGLLATSGLALLMLGGVLLRFYIKDSLVQIIPAMCFMLLALSILLAHLSIE